MSLATSFMNQHRRQPETTCLVIGDEYYTWAQVSEWVLAAVAHLEELSLDDTTVLGCKSEDVLDRIVWMVAASWAGYTWSLSRAVSLDDPQSVHWVEDSLKSRATTSSQPTVWSVNKPHWILQSSGTTGEPKLISLTWRQIEANASGAEDRFRLVKEDRWLCVLSLGHVAGASIIARSCVVGFSVCFGKFDPEEFSDTVNRHRITIMSVVPTMLSRIVACNPGVPESLRVLMVGGAAFPKSLESLAGTWPIWLTWGMSETASQIATSPIVEALEDGLEPIAGVQVSVDDEHFLCVHGAIAPGEIFRTSDIGTVSPGGRIQVHGRGDDVVKVGGNRVNLARVRRIFEEHTNQLEFEVFSVRDEEFGNHVGIAFTHDIEGSLNQLLLAADALEVWERPHWLMPMLELPLTSRFKVDREKLALECEARRQNVRARPSRLEFLPGNQLTTTNKSSDSFVHKDSEGRVTL